MMSIGVFAELVGLTASALRFYDDAGMLRPAQVDPSTGYRFYSRSQVPRACRLRQLREIGMPLPAISEFFAADADEAARLLDDHVVGMTMEAEKLRRAAETLAASLRAESRRVVCTVPGPVLAGAVDQVSASTGHDPDIPVLNGVHMETGSGCVRLTATDRYRLATRTLAHYLADLYDDPAESLVWDVRALDAADALTDERAREHHESLRVAGFYPSLHLNLADDFRRLGSFRAATEHLDRAQDHLSALPDDPYGDTIRTAVHEMRRAITDRDTAQRASAPGTARWGVRSDRRAATGAWWLGPASRGPTGPASCPASAVPVPPVLRTAERIGRPRDDMGCSRRDLVIASRTPVRLGGTRTRHGAHGEAFPVGPRGTVLGAHRRPEVGRGFVGRPAALAAGAGSVAARHDQNNLNSVLSVPRSAS